MKRLLIYTSFLWATLAVCATEHVDVWVDSVYNRLTLRQRVAQLFIPHLVIDDTPSGRARLLKLVRDDGVGGILLGAGTVSSYAALNRLAISAAAIPPLITADAEWGLAMRLKDAPRFPHNIALGAGDDVATMEAYGREMARECRSLGITVSFAPVADVNSNPLNPVIGFRSFGENPVRVAALAAAYARGLETGGVMAVAKHFPGHGDTSSDSHHTLPVVSKALTLLKDIDLLPFQTLINDGIGGVMVGHLDVPSLDKSGLPASLSPIVTSQLLKQQMSFDGLVFTDALEMKGARSPDGTNNCVAALIAGADILLGSLNPSGDIDAVVKAVKKGKISPKRIEESVRKVLTHKYYLTIINPIGVSEKSVRSVETSDINHRLARMCMTVIRNEKMILPLSKDSHIAVVPVGGRAVLFTDALKELVDKVSVIDDISAIGDDKAFDAVVVPIFASESKAVKSVSRISRVTGGRMIPVFFCNPYKLAAFKTALTGIASVVVAGDDTPELQAEAAGALAGIYPVDGRMPVSVSGVTSEGDGIHIEPKQSDIAVNTMKMSIDSLIDLGLEQGAYPGCQVMIVKDGKTLYNRSAGYISNKKKHCVTDSTLFDLASVSKLSGTLVAAMAAYDRGLFSMDDELSRFVPQSRSTDKAGLTIRQLMTHHTGLPPSINAYLFALDTATYSAPLFKSRRDDIYNIRVERNLWGNSEARLRHDIYASTHSVKYPLRAGGGIWASKAATDSIRDFILNCVNLNSSKRYCYSCLNYILLAEALRGATSESLDSWLDATVYGPMKLKRILYQPLDRYSIDEIAATEYDPMLRKQTVHGTVHDETAAMSGGIQGNAGLFANAASLAAVGTMLVAGGEWDSKQILSSETVNQFVENRIGFDTNGNNNRWIGHTGFTGTCMWLDTELKLVVVVLTNRVNPSRENKAFRALNFRNSVLALVESAFPR